MRELYIRIREDYFKDKRGLYKGLRPERNNVILLEILYKGLYKRIEREYTYKGLRTIL